MKTIEELLKTEDDARKKLGEADRTVASAERIQRADAKALLKAVEALHAEGERLGFDV